MTPHARLSLWCDHWRHSAHHAAALPSDRDDLPPLTVGDLRIIRAALDKKHTRFAHESQTNANSAPQEDRSNHHNARDTRMTTKISIFISGPKVELIHDDKAPVCNLGFTTAHRASHVEPQGSGDAIGWTADMTPTFGTNAPILGPFPTRTQALEAEREWLLQWLRRKTKATDPV